MTTMIVGEIANFAAYAFAPATLVTPLGALNIIISAVLAHIILKEKLHIFGFVGCLLCVVGSTAIVLHAPAEREIESVIDVWNLATEPGFLFYDALVMTAVECARSLSAAAMFDTNNWGDLDERDFTTMSMLQKEMDDRSLESILMRPPSGEFSLNVAADRLLTSFIGNYSSTESVEVSPPSSSGDTFQEEKPSNESTLERAMENLSVNDENREEKTQRCKFVQSLLLSTMFDDGL